MMPLQHALKLPVADAEKLGSPKMDTLVGFHVDGWDDRIGVHLPCDHGRETGEF